MVNEADLVPENLLNSAYRAGDELAWPQSEALAAVDFFADKRIAVLGIEVWLPERRRPRIPVPYVYTWDVGRKPDSEGWSDFVDRARDEARAYIGCFRWDPLDSEHRRCLPYFNLTLCSEEEFER